MRAHETIYWVGPVSPLKGQFWGISPRPLQIVGNILHARNILNFFWFQQHGHLLSVLQHLVTVEIVLG